LLAICDNDLADLQFLTGQMEEYFTVHPEHKSEINTFTGSAALRESLENGTHYSIFLLDILMPETDGIEIGRLIHAKSADAPIIYITSSDEFALKAFQNHALRYLVKPVRKDELFSALDFAYSLLPAPSDRTVTVKTRDGIVCLPVNDIILVENQNRSAYYTLRGGETIQSTSLRSTFENGIAPLSTDPDFLHTHKSFYVNMRCIRAFHPESLSLDDGREIPVSRGFFQKANRTYLEFLAGREEVK